MPKLLLTLCLLMVGCTGQVGDTPMTASPFMALSVPSSVPLQEAGGSADERGGGIFVAADGAVVRLRLDGTMGVLESHPQNPRPPGRVLRVYNAGPFVAMVATDNGLYVAESGWLIEPSWRDALDAQGIIAVAPGLAGSTWIAHQTGLFRIEAGQLSELKLEGGPILGLTALALAPAADGSPAVWFAQGESLSFARQTAVATYQVFDSQIDKSALKGGVKMLAGTSASPTDPGTLLVATASKLYQHGAHGFVPKAIPAPPVALISSGRFAWLMAGSTLYRYDADAAHWSTVEGVMGALDPESLLSAEPSGTAWVRAGDQTYAVSAGVLPRMLGLFEGQRVYETELLVRAQFPVASPPSSVSFVLDDGERVTRAAEQALPGDGAAKTLDFAWGGFDVAGREQPYSLVGFAPGLHTLTISATFGSGAQATQQQTRALHFEFRGGSTEALSFATDVLPIARARCAKCHDAGPGHVMQTYEQWLADKDKILAALIEQRMPADGPLDPTQLQTIQRWAVGGAAP